MKKSRGVKEEGSNIESNLYGLGALGHCHGHCNRNKCSAGGRRVGSYDFDSQKKFDAPTRPTDDRAIPEKKMLKSCTQTDVLETPVFEAYLSRTSSLANSLSDTRL